MKNITLGLRIFASIVIVFGVAGMYLVWNKIYEPGQIAEQQTEDLKDTDTDGANTTKPLVSDPASPTSTDPTSPEHLEVPTTPSENPKLVPTSDAITCDEIKEATFKKCQADCPAEANIAIYNECTAGCDKIGNLLAKSDCTNKCISDWSKAKSARSDCISSCLKDYYATDCP